MESRSHKLPPSKANLNFTDDDDGEIPIGEKTLPTPSNCIAMSLVSLSFINDAMGDAVKVDCRTMHNNDADRERNRGYLYATTESWRWNWGTALYLSLFTCIICLMLVSSSLLLFVALFSRSVGTAFCARLS